MNADDFVANVAAQAPSLEELQAQGLSPGGAEEFRKTYLCPPKPRPEPGNDNPLLDLLARYDTSRLEIGMVTLNPASWEEAGRKAFTKRNQRVVGALESDPLVLNLATGAIENLDHSDLSFTICECAASGGQFLDALVLMAAFDKPHPYQAGQKLTKEQEWENYRAALETARQCAQAAGIESEEGDVYQTLLGVWEPEG